MAKSLSDAFEPIRHATRVQQYSKIIATFMPLILLTASIVINIFQGREISKLRADLDKKLLKAQLSVGTVVTPIKAKDLDGNDVSVSYFGSNKETVLYVFSPQCGWCNRNMQNINTVAGQIGSGHRLIGISLSQNGLQEYVEKNNISFPVYHNLPKEVISDYKLGSTPQTIVISADGKVVKNWQGAFAGSLQKEVEEYFKVELPGLSK